MTRATELRARRSAHVRGVERSERERAIATLDEAFALDPICTWTWPEEADRRRRFPRFAAALGGRAFAFGTADATDEFDGVALWIPPAVEPDGEEVITAFVSGAPESRHGELLSLIAQMCAFHPTEPHWYLPLIGVGATRQGEGLGAALLRYGLARCDADGVPAYLEATSPRNVPLYERHGFRAIGVIRSGSSPPMVPMLRPPVIASA